MNLKSVNRLQYYTNCILGYLLIACFSNCDNSGSKINSSSLITDPGMQDSIFKTLVSFTDHSIPENELSDSLAFLVLPVEASCPSCRKRTIDSILKNINNLIQNHYIIISASGGYKTINSYFREQNGKLPEMKSNLFLDTTHLALKKELFENNTVIYYTSNRKAFKKVSSIPATIREDLREFFSGTRSDKHITSK
ncbi:hypothetical protein [Longitalea arenae]|uniref:hypothetical protein n=1 Tax=Longitalea arenae TaxID=2812558 RepID=UPI0019670DA8|nr:hypothetical protein [Longitalea arenae]